MAVVKPSCVRRQRCSCRTKPRARGSEHFMAISQAMGEAQLAPTAASSAASSAGRRLAVVAPWQSSAKQSSAASERATARFDGPPSSAAGVVMLGPPPVRASSRCTNTDGSHRRAAVRENVSTRIAVAAASRTRYGGADPPPLRHLPTASEMGCANSVSVRSQRRSRQTRRWRRDPRDVSAVASSKSSTSCLHAAGETTP